MASKTDYKNSNLKPWYKRWWGRLWPPKGEEKSAFVWNEARGLWIDRNDPNCHNNIRSGYEHPQQIYYKSNLTPQPNRTVSSGQIKIPPENNLPRSARYGNPLVSELQMHQNSLQLIDLDTPLEAAQNNYQHLVASRNDRMPSTQHVSKPVNEDLLMGNDNLPTNMESRPPPISTAYNPRNNSNLIDFAQETTRNNQAQNNYPEYGSRPPQTTEPDSSAMKNDWSRNRYDSFRFPAFAVVSELAPVNSHFTDSRPIDYSRTSMGHGAHMDSITEQTYYSSLYTPLQSELDSAQINTAPAYSSYTIEMDNSDSAIFNMDV